MYELGSSSYEGQWIMLSITLNSQRALYYTQVVDFPVLGRVCCKPCCSDNMRCFRVVLRLKEVEKGVWTKFSHLARVQ